MVYVTKENTRFKAARSRGPGGQNVNKRSTKVQIWAKIFDLPLRDEERSLLREKLTSHITKNDELEVSCEEERSQEQNHDRALEIMNILIEKALEIPKVRIPTEPPLGIEEKFREERNTHSLKKKHRYQSKRPYLEDLNE